MTAELYERFQGHRITVQRSWATCASPTPSNGYIEFKNSILLSEILAELNHVAEWTLNDYQTNLVQRLKHRDENADDFINFETKASTPTNRYYWRLIGEVFEIDTLGEKLSLIAPRIKHQLKISYEPILPRNVGNQEEYFINTVPTLKLVPVADLLDDVGVDGIKSLVIVDELFIDLKDITYLSLEVHANLKNILETQYPSLAAKLYRFNAATYDLAKDIRTYLNRGMTAKQAIDSLNHRLFLSPNPSDEVDALVERFDLYFSSLPEALKAQVSALTNSSNQPLDFIVHNEFAEDVSNSLHDFIKKNEENAALNTCPFMSRAEISDLVERYTFIEDAAGLYFDDETSVYWLPINKTKRILNAHDFNDTNQLLIWVRNHGDLFFTMLLPYITLNVNSLVFLIRLNLTKDQAEILADYILQLEDINVLDEVLKQDSIAFASIMLHLSEEERAHWILSSDDLGRTKLEKHFNNIQRFSILYNLIPKQFRFLALKVAKQGNLLLQGLYPAIFIFVMSQFPQQWQTPSKVRAILNGTTRLYQLANVMCLMVKPTEEEFSDIILEIDMYYSRSLCESYTPEFIASTELALKNKIEAKYSGFGSHPRMYCGRFFAAIANTENDNLPNDSNLIPYKSKQ